MSIVEKMARDCDWPSGRLFTFMDDPGEHNPCYVVMPDGACIALNHHARPDVDIARAQFIIAACNAATGLTEVQLEGLANGTMVVVKAGAEGERYVRIKESCYRELLTDMVDHAYAAGSASCGEWRTAGMADAEWLARMIGANEGGPNMVSDMKRRIGHFIESAMLAAKEG